MVTAITAMLEVPGHPVEAVDPSRTTLYTSRASTRQSDAYYTHRVRERDDDADHGQRRTVAGLPRTRCLPQTRCSRLGRRHLKLAGSGSILRTVSTARCDTATTGSAPHGPGPRRQRRRKSVRTRGRLKVGPVVVQGPAFCRSRRAALSPWSCAGHRGSSRRLEQRRRSRMPRLPDNRVSYSDRLDRPTD